MKNNHKLIIVAGAAGEIGSEYCRQLTLSGYDCIGIVRNKRSHIVSSHYQELRCNLDNEKEINAVLSNVNLGQYEEIIYLHTIGIDRFDPRGYPEIKPMETIDSGIYNTNVNSFKYLLKYCVQTIEEINKAAAHKTRLRIAIIAGVGDKHAPFVIEGFCEAKFILREYIRSCIGIHPECISGLSINISSTVTKSALQVRPYADTTYWLTPQEVVTESLASLIADSSSYEEIDIIKHSPEYTPGYYTNNELLYEKWSADTGLKQ